MTAGGGERFGIIRPVNRVRQKEAAEEHDLSDEESPHPERARLPLLLHVVEVMS
jgi:hypothetical protein